MIPVEIEQSVLTINATGVWWVVTTSSVLAILWAIHTWWVRPHRKTFKDKGVFLELDAASNTLRIESGQDMRTLSLKLGCGRFDFTRQYSIEMKERWRSGSSATVTLYDTGCGTQTGTVKPGTEGGWETITTKTSTGSTHVTVSELDPILHFYQQWANHPDRKKHATETRIVMLELRNRAAHALQRWVNAHRHELIPSEKAYRKKWDASCKHLLEECRKAPGVRKLKKPLEVFDYSTTPAIRYLAIGKMGEVCIKTLEGNTVRELDFGQIQGEGSTLTVAFPNGWKERFALKDGQVSQLHQIRRQWQKQQARANKHAKQVA